MLTFIIPLRSKESSSNWERVCQLFNRSIRSVCAQTSDAFKVIVVCHEKSLGAFVHPNLEYVFVDFPLPHNWKEKKADQHRKLMAGLLHFRNLSSQYSQKGHVLLMDADDCVSKNLAKFVESNPHENGWFISQGYVYKDGDWYLFGNRQTFYQWCGTANILRWDAFNYLDSVDDSNADYSHYHLPHPEVPKIMSSRGMPLQPLPFPGAVYIIGHDDNLHLERGTYSNAQAPTKLIQDYGSFLKKIILNYRILNPFIRNEFGLERLY